MLRIGAPLRDVLTLVLGLSLVTARVAAGQEPIQWGRGEPVAFTTFSIAAIDPETGEVGVAVTTRNPCVAMRVPWVRAGVGALATQGATRLEYGPEVLDMLAAGVPAREALARAVARDTGASSRQVGVISLKLGAAQHTGKAQYDEGWTGQRAGSDYVTQGNSLVPGGVVDSVAVTFERSRGSDRRLADRLIEALAAGQAVGGDMRHGRVQSAAVRVADARPGRSRRPDGVTVDISVCEHTEPVGELRRTYDAITEKLGFRPLQQPVGADVFELKLMLHALGYYRPEADSLSQDADAFRYTPDLVLAVGSFRQSLGFSPEPAVVDAELTGRLWKALEAAGKAGAVRKRLKALTP